MTDQPDPRLAFTPQARPVIDDGPEPVHACGHDECRMPGCHYRRRSA